MIKISETELEIMNVIWEKGEATSHEIIEQLKSNSQKDNWTANTVRTLLNRLCNKGALSTRAIGKKMLMYSSNINERSYKKQLTLELIRKLFNNSLENFILTYYQSGYIEKEELLRILREARDRLIEKQKQENEKNANKGD